MDSARVWVARWWPEGGTGILVITDAAGDVWLNGQTLSAVASEDAFNHLLHSRGWCTVPGSAWHQQGAVWARHVYPESAETAERMRAAIPGV